MGKILIGENAAWKMSFFCQVFAVTLKRRTTRYGTRRREKAQKSD
jgi:hypothetical protein